MNKISSGKPLRSLAKNSVTTDHHDLTEKLLKATQDPIATTLLHELLISSQLGCNFITVNVLKFPTLVAYQQGLAKQHRLKQSDHGIPCLLFWYTICEFQPWLPSFYLTTEREKCSEILEHLRYSTQIHKLLVRIENREDPDQTAS